MFKIAEELMQKIKEVVAINEPVLAVGNGLMYFGNCHDHCSISCSNRCDGSCRGNCQGSCQRFSR